VSLQPHQSAFNKLFNVHAVLEQELKYYSCVTQGVSPRPPSLPPSLPSSLPSFLCNLWSFCFPLISIKLC